MPVGPNGEKRPSDVIANAIHAMPVATGEAEETHLNSGQSARGRKKGCCAGEEFEREAAKRGRRGGGIGVMGLMRTPPPRLGKPNWGVPDRGMIGKRQRHWDLSS